jgi:hypothetical protein
MAGFLGKAPFASDIGLFLEIAVTVLLFVGRFGFARRGRTRAHGFALASAVLLHFVSVLVIMIPSFVVSTSILFNGFSSPAIILTWIHVPLGLTVLAIGLFLVFEWQFRMPNSKCYKRLGLMRPLWLLWMFILILGYLIYLSIAIYS